MGKITTVRNDKRDEFNRQTAVGFDQRLQKVERDSSRPVDRSVTTSTTRRRQRRAGPRERRRETEPRRAAARTGSTGSAGVSTDGGTTRTVTAVGGGHVLAEGDTIQFSIPAALVAAAGVGLAGAIVGGMLT